ncbi:MAG: DUF1343 domain-containing protein [Candidatus Riflebacteria bacterium]|nr:DUF1343 domain-containing protein [Candidatus Riflebacteria bacterium]
MAGFEFGLEAFLADPGVGGRVGLVSNATGIDRNGTHVAYRLAGHPRLRLTRLFSPEHGFWSDAPDGEAVGHAVHPRLGAPIVSLYGERKIPSPADLADLDLLVYDIQDVGVRFYTYISTLRNVIDAAAPLGLPVHVLDRPNPVGGFEVEGPALTAGFASFVGHLPVPLRYGLTPGELAAWYASTLPNPGPIKVWPCAGYTRGAIFANLGIPWVKPSPSMATPATALFYPGTCLFEGLNASEGRGSDAPFQILGAPWVDPDRWLASLRPTLPGNVTVRPVEFRPTFAKFTGEACRGIRLDTGSGHLDGAVGVGLRVIQALMRSHPGKVEFPGRPNLDRPFFDLLAGNSWVREGLLADLDAGQLEERARAECQAFRRDRERFFLYR